MQCKNNNEDSVSDFLISVVSFEQGSKLCVTSELEKDLNLKTTAATKGIEKDKQSFFCPLNKKILENISTR